MPRKPPPHRRPRDPFRKAQRAPQIRQPGPSPMKAEMQQIDPGDWDLIVLIRSGEAQVRGRRTRQAGKALRIVAAETERWEEQ